jgi:hypothetical protein
MDSILFESNTDEPTEFTFAGESIQNFGDVKIVTKEYLDNLFNV